MSTTAQAVPRADRLEISLPKGLVIVGLVAALYGPVLTQMVIQWWQDPDYGDRFVVPVFVGYVLSQRRHKLRQVSLEPNNFGFPLMLGAIGLLLVGTLGAELFVSRSSLLFLLGGILLFFAGWKMLSAVAFPLAFLALMIPLPALIYNQVTFPLQLLASRLASNSLELLGIPVLREGNVLVLPTYSLEVVEACSGIRSLMSLIALAVAYGYFVEQRLWARITLVVMMLPIAVASNALRVVGAGVVTYFWGPQYAEGFFHFFQGWLIFVSAVGCMLFVHWFLSHLAPLRRKAGA
ncbi:MAG TPA: exosortase/archaeosortase family protein [Candidatus Dormibacteraeota bacterium]|nr:exosortase/archaeosortase family protein [Candidatus Dormibacteraeota bacterium]